MITLILAILIGIAISLFSTQNIHAVTITLANYPITGVPLYMIVIVSLLLGIMISFIFHTISLLSSTLLLHQRNTKIKNAHMIIADLQEKIHQLEVENARLKEREEEQSESAEPDEEQHQNPLASLFSPKLYHHKI